MIKGMFGVRGGMNILLRPIFQGPLLRGKITGAECSESRIRRIFECAPYITLENGVPAPEEFESLEPACRFTGQLKLIGVGQSTTVSKDSRECHLARGKVGGQALMSHASVRGKFKGIC